MRLIFNHQNAYGRNLYYPHNEPARLLCEAFKVKSLTPFQVAKLEEAGIELKTDGPSKRRDKKENEQDDKSQHGKN